MPAVLGLGPGVDLVVTRKGNEAELRGECVPKLELGNEEGLME
jgi:hypothetical protein